MEGVEKLENSDSKVPMNQREETSFDFSDSLVRQKTLWPGRHLSPFG